MNLQAREIKPGRQKGRTARHAGNGSGMLIILHLLVMAGVLFFIVNYRISLKDGIGRLSREADQLKRELHRYNREIEHLKLKKEHLCRWSYIRQKIIAYNLPLIQPEPGQVRNVAINRSSVTAEELYSQDTKVIVSQR